MGPFRPRKIIDCKKDSYFPDSSMSRQKSAFSSGRHVRLIIHRNVMGAIKVVTFKNTNGIIENF